MRISRTLLILLIIPVIFLMAVPALAEKIVYPKDVHFFEGFTDEQLKEIQKEVDGGYHSWYADPSAYAKFFMSYTYPRLHPNIRKKMPAELTFEDKTAVVEVIYQNKKHLIYLYRAFPEDTKSIWIVEKMIIE